MAVTLESYPVFTQDGIINNIFPGFLPLTIDFKREDLEIISITQGVNDKILITVLGDITSDISALEFLYFYSEGTTYTYNDSGQILDITFGGVNTEITIDFDFIEISSGGYINYLQDWLLEMRLVSPDNQNIKVIKPTLADDGTNSGEVSIDISIAVDTLTQEIKFAGGEVTEGRVKFQCEYRPSWRDNRDEAWILIDDTPIIVVFSAEEFEPEMFIMALDNPILWEGYLTGISYCHSDSNYLAERLQAVFDELDINKDVISSNNLIRNFNVGDYGFLFVSTEDIPSFTFNQYTKYGRLKIQTTIAPDFEPVDFDTPDFQVT